MKLPRLITRRRAKWVGLVLCVVVLVAYVGSIWLEANVLRYTNSSSTLLGIGSGRLVAVRSYCSDGPMFGPSSSHMRWTRREPKVYLWWDWGFRENTNQSTGWLIHTTAIWIPLWLPLLLIAAPTAWLWRTDRHAKPWQCANCRYDLRGLKGGENGVCPECGKPMERKA